jgi:hypothetical protein
MKHTNIHSNTQCNLEAVNEKTVNFITTDNYQYTQLLKNTGDLIILHSDNRHDIYLAGEQIAGGYGFNDDSHISRLTYVADSIYEDLTYIHNNIDVLQNIIGEYTDNGTIINNTYISTYTQQITCGYATYSLVKIDDNTFGFNWSCITNIKNFVLNYYTNDNSENSYIINTDNVNNTYICLHPDEELKLNNNTITFTFEGSYNIEKVGVIANTKYNNLNTDQLTDNVIEMYDYNVNATIDINEINTYLPVFNHTLYDSLLFVFEDTRPAVTEYKIANIYWSLPIFYKTGDDYTQYTNKIWREDYGAINTMIKNCKITFTFNSFDKEYAYIKIPQSWGVPRFKHEESGLIQNWDKTSGVAEEVVICKDSKGKEVKINYIEYRSPQKYTNASITWEIL